MLSNFVQDSESILYENLFFWLTLGKYDTALCAKFRNYQHEEFVIVGEQWKDRIKYLENVISIQTQRFIKEYKQESYFSRNTFFSVKFRIYFVIYTTPVTGRLLGLGIRIITPDTDTSTEFAMTPEDRLQKAMYLISRGLLRSYHHRIDQFECPIPI
ncbi:MAG: hypothetical protein ACXADY_03395 [Candidatus Hodarchaeales archaeon]|jgi:hypothetical protein